MTFSNFINRYNVYLDILFVFFLIAFQFYVAVSYQDFVAVSNGVLRWPSLFFLVSPLVILYLFLRFFTPPLFSVLCALFVLIVISAIHHVKLSLTGEPLSWSDIVAVQNMSVIKHYLSVKHILIISVFVVLFAASFFINNKVKMHAVMRGVQLLLLLVLIPFSFNLNVNKLLSDELSMKYNFMLMKNDIAYREWDWRYNITMNGLLPHILQTSNRSVPSKPSESEVNNFSRLLNTNNKTNAQPDNIIFILCESCWHNDDFFYEAFSGLKQRGFKPFRAISPSYGGGTVNASFELHTGLPAKGVLDGVIYQEYAELFSNELYSYPQSLKKAGYNTFSAHNHSREFWKRDVVHPKMGFDKFLDIKDMEKIDAQGWPDDRILFDAAFKEFETNPKDNYMYLISVSTHGKYNYEDDFGEGYYYSRLIESLTRVNDFVDKVLAKKPNTLIFLFGDHKPSLNKFFYVNGVFDPEDYLNIGGDGDAGFVFKGDVSPIKTGDVPAYIYHPDSEKVESFIEKADGKPFYCITNYLDQEFTSVGTPAFLYDRENNVCDSFGENGYNTSISKYPSWLYYLSLF